MGAKEGGQVCRSRSHLLGHLVDPRGGAVTEVRTPRVPHDLICQALERSDACREEGGWGGYKQRESVTTV